MNGAVTSSPLVCRHWVGRGSCNSVLYDYISCYRCIDLHYLLVNKDWTMMCRVTVVAYLKAVFHNFYGATEETYRIASQRTRFPGCDLNPSHSDCDSTKPSWVKHRLVSFWGTQTCSCVRECMFLCSCVHVRACTCVYICVCPGVCAYECVRLCCVCRCENDLCLSCYTRRADVD